MIFSDEPVGEAALQQLDEYLTSDDAPPECMMLSDLDGFLTAIAIGPELIMPSEWLPLIWGGDPPHFKDNDHAQQIIGTIMGRYNEILRGIEAGISEPIFWESKDEITIAADWAEGFLDGVKLRIDAWEPLFKSKRQVVNLLPILAHCGDENGASLMGFDPETEERIMAEAHNEIPDCVIEIAAYWRKRRSSPLAEPSSRGATHDQKQKRNDLCICGSGIKFKKCCGKPN